MTEKEATAFLENRKRLGKEKRQETMQKLCDVLGNPQDKLQFVHLTGTNGKGSTAKMISCILTAAGYRTGLYTSPHLCDIKERMAIDGKNIAAREFGNVVKRVKTATDQLETQGYYATEFECITAAAFLWYAEKQCDVVCLEVGIGGAHDATNVIRNTKVACILPIAMDHTAQLGTTPAAIATEKCGIFKPGCTVVCAPTQLPTVQTVIETAAKKQKLPLRVPQVEDIHLLWSTLRENHIDYGGYEVSLKLPGAHQAANAAVAIETALALCDQDFEISDEAILTGLSSARLPARIEMVSYDPLVLIDGAHNPSGGAALAQTLTVARATPVTAILGMMADKDAAAYLKELAGCFDCVYTVPADDGSRCMSPDALALICSEYFRHVEAKNSFEEAVEAARKRAHGLCVCGSFYLAGQAEKFFH